MKLAYIIFPTTTLFILFIWLTAFEIVSIAVMFAAILTWFIIVFGSIAYYDLKE